jgi:hypothetical protein
VGGEFGVFILICIQSPKSLEYRYRVGGSLRTRVAAVDLTLLLRWDKYSTRNKYTYGRVSIPVESQVSDWMNLLQFPREDSFMYGIGVGIKWLGIELSPIIRHAKFGIFF